MKLAFLAALRNCLWNRDNGQIPPWGPCDNANEVTQAGIGPSIVKLGQGTVPFPLSMPPCFGFCGHGSDGGGGRGELGASCCVCPSAVHLACGFKSVELKALLRNNGLSLPCINRL